MKHKVRNISALCSLLLATGLARADELNMPVGVTEISEKVYDLHMLIFWVCVIIGCVVFGAMLCQNAPNGRYHENRKQQPTQTSSTFIGYHFGS